MSEIQTLLADSCPGFTDRVNQEEGAEAVWPADLWTVTTRSRTGEFVPGT